MNKIDAILSERQKQHGDFADHARYTQELKQAMQRSANWFDLDHMHREALEMIVHKIGRILAGDPFHEDHWNDIAGYAVLASGRARVEKPVLAKKTPGGWLDIAHQTSELKG